MLYKLPRPRSISRSVFLRILEYLSIPNEIPCRWATSLRQSLCFLYASYAESEANLIMYVNNLGHNCLKFDNEGHSTVAVVTLPKRSRAWNVESLRSSDQIQTRKGAVMDKADGTHTTPGVPANNNAVMILFANLINDVT